MADQTTTSANVVNIFSGLVGKITGWVDSLFALFINANAKYSKWFIYILVILAVSKVLKLNIKKSV